MKNLTTWIVLQLLNFAMMQKLELHFVRRWRFPFSRSIPINLKKNCNSKFCTKTNFGSPKKIPNRQILHFFLKGRRSYQNENPKMKNKMKKIDFENLKSGFKIDFNFSKLFFVLSFYFFRFFIIDDFVTWMDWNKQY